jgi:hypothetical protein
MGNHVCKFTADVTEVEGKGEEVHNVPHVEEVAEATVFQLDDLKNQERDEGLTEQNETDDLKNEGDGESVFFVMGEDTGEGDEGHHVDDEGREQLAEDRIVVSLPHEVDEDADLGGRKDLIVVRLS